MSESNLPPEQWRPLFDRAGIEFGYRPLAARAGLTHTRVHRLIRGGGTTDEAIQMVAAALGVKASKVRELRDEPAVEIEPFILPDDAGRLNDKERDAIRAVIRALLDAKDERDADEPIADTDSTSESDAPDEAHKGQEARQYTVFRYDPAHPESIGQGPFITAIDDDDARDQIRHSLEVTGLPIDPQSDPTITVTRRGDAFTLIGLVREDVSAEWEERTIARLRERGAQLEQSDNSGRERRLPRVTNSQLDRDQPGTDGPANTSETGSNTTGSGDQVPSDAAAAQMTDVELQRAAQTDPLWADYVKTKRPELILDF